MTTQPYILYFTDSPEAEASTQTAKDMSQVIERACILPMNRDTWQSKIVKLKGTNSLCILATHGGIGEDGVLQSFMESLGVIHTHSSAQASIMMTHKHTTKLVYRALDIPTPAWSYGQFTSDKFPENIKIIQKPVKGGSKRDIGIKNNTQHVDNGLKYIYELYVEGIYEVSVPVLRQGSQHIALSPIVRLRRSGSIGHLVDVSSESLEAQILKDCKIMAVKFSEAVNCFGITKTDFVIDIHSNPWAIETDAIPGLARNNASALAAEKAGISYKDLIGAIMRTTYCE